MNETSIQVPPGEQTLLIPTELARILERLGIVAESLTKTVEYFPELFRRLAVKGMVIVECKVKFIAEAQRREAAERKEATMLEMM